MAWNQGIYNVQNRSKYIGIKSPVFRSGWERSYFHYLDTNPDVIRWISEGFKLPYIFNLDNKKHNYYVDVYFEKKVNDKIYKVLIEIKPYKELFPPELPKNRTYKSMKNYNYRMVSYNKNQSKWRFCSEYARTSGMDFYILTEKGIYTYPLRKVSDKTYF